MIGDILLIEDGVTAAKAYKQLLNQHLADAKVYHAEGEDEALTIVKQRDIHVVIFDQRLNPGETGTEIFKKIKEIDDNIVGIMLTGRAGKKEVAEAVNLGVYRYIDKLEQDLSEKIVQTVLEGLELYANNAIFTDTIEIKKYLPIGNFLSKQKYFLDSIQLVDKNYIFEDQWTDKALIEAGVNTEETFTLTHSVKTIVEEEKLNEISSKAKVKVKQLQNSILGEVSAALKEKNKLTTTITQDEQATIKKIYSIPDVPSELDSTYLAAKCYQTNLVYEKYRVLLEVQCKSCGGCNKFSINLFASTHKIQLRQIDHFSSGEKNIINCGYASEAI